MIRASTPYRYAAEKTKSVFLPGFEGLSLHEVSVFFRAQVKKVGLNDRARSISFSFLMAIPAATIFLCTLIPYLPVSKKLTGQLLLLTREITPNQNTYALVSNFLNDFLNKPRGGLLSFGLIVALYYASNAMIGLIRTFNKSLPGYKRRNFVDNRIVAIRLTLVLIVLVIGSVVILMTQDELLRYVFKALHVHRRNMKGLVKSIRWIATDSKLRMDVQALRGQIEADRAAGDVPFLVVGTAGSVSTGTVDPLPEISALCKQYGLWFHVDGAYGGFAAAVSQAHDDLRGLGLADSVAVDPHKWLYAPLEAGCALVRDPEMLRAAFAYHPPYYHFEEKVTNYVDCGPQNSRGFRALKVWLALKQVGAEGYRNMIGEDIRLSQAMARAVSRHQELQLMTEELSITTFRYVPHDLRGRLGQAEVELHLDMLNRELLDRLQRGGETFISNAVVGGRYLLRACIVNFHTTHADVEAVPSIVVRIGRELNAELRAANSLPDAQ